MDPYPCQVVGGDIWLSTRTDEAEKAKSFCNKCPIKVECLTGAIERGEEWGIWGGQIIYKGKLTDHFVPSGRKKKPKP